MSEDISINRWMRRTRAYVFHFVLFQDESGVYRTTCGRANTANMVDLSNEEFRELQDHPSLRCGNCDISPRSIDPNNERYIHIKR